ncbi:MAG: hypothetical protein ACM3JI_02640 [Anaerolineae bacterium]
MHIRGKALYNLLSLSWREDSTLQVQRWQVENYRALSLEEIFKRLKALDIVLSKESFLLYAESCSSPEELTEFLWVKENDHEQQDQAYLLLFELWRRLVKDKQPLSIFCDELDDRIDLYDRKALASDDGVQEILAELEDVLDRHVDQGEKPKEVFSILSQSCAHDLETFIYDYIVDQIDQGHELYASELLDGFAEYVEDEKWFAFLRVRLFFSSDAEEGSRLLKGLLEQVQEEPDVDLAFEMASFLVHAGDEALFWQTASLIFESLKTEADFQELLAVISDYFRRRDQDQEHQNVQAIIARRADKEGGALLTSKDVDRKRLKSLLTAQLSTF